MISANDGLDKIMRKLNFRGYSSSVRQQDEHFWVKEAH